MKLATVLAINYCWYLVNTGVNICWKSVTNKWKVSLHVLWSHQNSQWPTVPAFEEPTAEFLDLGACTGGPETWLHKEQKQIEIKTQRSALNMSASFPVSSYNAHQKEWWRRLIQRYRKATWSSWRHRFRKAPFSRRISVHGRCWSNHIEINLRFQISPM